MQSLQIGISFAKEMAHAHERWLMCILGVCRYVCVRQCNLAYILMCMKFRKYGGLVRNRPLSRVFVLNKLHHLWLSYHLSVHHKENWTIGHIPLTLNSNLLVLFILLCYSSTFFCSIFIHIHTYYNKLKSKNLRLRGSKILICSLCLSFLSS